MICVCVCVCDHMLYMLYMWSFMNEYKNITYLFFVFKAIFKFHQYNPVMQYYTYFVNVIWTKCFWIYIYIRF